MTKTIISVVGTRPNFMKVGPLERQFKTLQHINHMIVHTGQHYDELMSGVFLMIWDYRLQRVTSESAPADTER